ncbi:MAG: citramalate synthase, partial [Myxococcales bacterium]|nr:citramalate synthase [Myxococcales bacterium]
MVDPGELPVEVEIYDTTLRDGTQGEGISLSVQDKLRIARLLDGLGVAYIEAGFPGSNPKDAEFFALASAQRWRAKLVAFGSTCRPGLAASEDPQLQLLVGAQTEVCTIFGKSWGLHVREVLRTSLGQNLALIEDSVAFLRAQGRRVIFDAEHFFDGYADDPVYAIEVLRAARRGGAETLVLCDTNGGRMPWQIREAFEELHALLDRPLGVHAHDDSGCAVANSLEALRAGARQVQGTINGYGERCGNANLCTLIADIELKLGRRCLPAGRLEHLLEVSHLIAEIANVKHEAQAPYVGQSAFAHKGGVHVSAVRRVRESYEHIDPSRVGNRTRVLVSELSGRANLHSKAEEHGLSLEAEMAAEVLSEIKEGEARGMSYEAAEASVALLIQRREPDYRPPFEVLSYQIAAGRRGEETPFAEATVKLALANREVHTAADGDGPISALDRALRKALAPVFPEVERIALEDYKVRILDSGAGTSATTRVLIDGRCGEHRFCTVGASVDIVAASLMALV